MKTWLAFHQTRHPRLPDEVFWAYSPHLLALPPEDESRAHHPPPVEGFGANSLHLLTLPPEEKSGADSLHLVTLLPE